MEADRACKYSSPLKPYCSIIIMQFTAIGTHKEYIKNGMPFKIHGAPMTYMYDLAR